MNSWSKGTQKQYSSLINLFDYCTRHNIDSSDSSANEGAEFLAEYFHEDVSYSMVNTAWSALSSVFPAKNVTPFGKHILIVRLLGGIFKQRPSLPRYTVSYDVAKALQYISKLIFKNVFGRSDKKVSNIKCAYFQ